MNPLKRLAGQTAIYGVSSIVGRVINFLLVPLYTRVFVPGEYGVVTEMYTYVAFLLIVLTYGMETAFFRFSESSPDRRNTIFSTSLLSVLATSTVFILLVILFRNPLAEVMRYPDNVEYIVLLGMIVGLDALAAIPFARLRAANRPWRFALVKLAGIAINIGLVLIFLLLFPWILRHGPEFMRPLVNLVYDPGIGVGYVFIANLVATVFTVLLLMPVMRSVRPVFDSLLWRKMLLYALPLLVAGLAGWINEALDKLLLKYILPENIAMAQVGIYGAVYKLSIMMTIFIQAFRFAAEPFFFSQAAREDSRELYARVMNFFVVTCLFIFLGIMLFMDVVKHFIGSAYHEGLPVVPVLLIANMFLGIYFNLSIWYKLTARTMFGAWFSVIGALITIVLNIWWIPQFGYHGSAWATLVCYFTLALLSYLFGQRYYKIPYEPGRIGVMILAALGVFFISTYTSAIDGAWMYVVHIILLGLFGALVLLIEPSLRSVFPRRS
ncbi:MAG: polysaccharide biosynthesis C-terminal domain-containing protein [Bacteroidales bacterium]